MPAIYSVTLGNGVHAIQVDGIRETSEANAVVSAMLIAVHNRRIGKEVAASLIRAGCYSVRLVRKLPKKRPNSLDDPSPGD